MQLGDPVAGQLFRGPDMAKGAGVASGQPGV